MRLCEEGREEEKEEGLEANLVQAELKVDHAGVFFILEILYVKGDLSSQEEEQEDPPNGCSESTLNTQPCTGYHYNISEIGQSDSNEIGRGLNSARDELNI